MNGIKFFLSDPAFIVKSGSICEGPSSRWMPCYHALSYPSNFAHAKNTFILILQRVQAFFMMLFYFFSSPLKYLKVPENTRRVLGEIGASTSILVGGKMRSIIFEQQPLFSASGRASSTSKDRTHHYSIFKEGG